MPIRYQIERSPALLYVYTCGKLTGEQYFEAAREWSREEAFDRTDLGLFEIGSDTVMDVDGLNFEKATEKRLSMMDAHGGLTRRVAFASGAPDVRSFMAMVQEIFNDRPKVRTFQSVAEARQWLLS